MGQRAGQQPWRHRRPPHPPTWPDHRESAAGRPRRRRCWRGTHGGEIDAGAEMPIDRVAADRFKLRLRQGAARDRDFPRLIDAPLRRHGPEIAQELVSRLPDQRIEDELGRASRICSMTRRKSVSPTAKYRSAAMEPPCPTTACRRSGCFPTPRYSWSRCTRHSCRNASADDRAAERCAGWVPHRYRRRCRRSRTLHSATDTRAAAPCFSKSGMTSLRLDEV